MVDRSPGRGYSLDMKNTAKNGTRGGTRVTATQLAALVSLTESAHYQGGTTACGGDRASSTVAGLERKGLAVLHRSRKQSFCSPTAAGRALAINELRRRHAAGDNVARLTIMDLTGEAL